jgi:thiol-disulfide isomerase/thioredoxin
MMPPRDVHDGRLRYLPSLLFIGALTVGIVVAAFVDNADPTVEVGAKAPPFTVDLLDGGSFDLETHLREDGRPVVLNLWGSWCPPCRSEVPEISDFAATKDDVYVIGVTIRDPVENTRRFVSEVEPNYDIGIGNEAFIARYPSFGLPNTFVIDSNGRVTQYVAGIVTANSLQQLIP